MQQLLRAEADRLLRCAGAFMVCADKAEQCLEERAFSPFWDYVDESRQVAGDIAHIGLHLSSIQSALSGTPWEWGNASHNSIRLRSLSTEERNRRNYFSGPDRTVESPVVAAVTVPDLQRAAERIEAVRDKAMRDFEFAQIYETRRVREAVIEANAELAESFRVAIRAVEQIRDTGRHIAVAIECGAASIERSLEHIAETVMHSTESAEAAVEILDNIQRRRLPAGADRDDSDY